MPVARFVEYFIVSLILYEKYRQPHECVCYLIMLAVGYSSILFAFSAVLISANSFMCACLDINRCVD